MYLEDDDLCKRLVDLEYKNAVLTTARIIHLEGKSISKNKERKKFTIKAKISIGRSTTASCRHF